MGQSKIAVFDEKKRKALLEACADDQEYIVIWIFMNTGMHPKNLINLQLKNIDVDDGWLQYKRAKNAKPIRKLLPHDIAQKLARFVDSKKKPRRPTTRQAYWLICREVGLRVGIRDLSPMTLRHTYCHLELERLKDHPDKFDLIAIEMGCKKETVQRNYLDFLAWSEMKGM